MMRGILINPWWETVTEVEIEEGIDDICRFLGPIFCCAMNWTNGDTLYVDDEGLLKRDMKMFDINRADGQLLAGNGLILGSDSEGNSKDAESLLIEIQHQVSF